MPEMVAESLREGATSGPPLVEHEDETHRREDRKPNG